MRRLNESMAAYIAGFLDGDGSIYVRLKPNTQYRYGFQVAPNIVFYQSQKEIKFLERVKNEIGAGYIRKRNDGIAEYTIGDVGTMRELIYQIHPHLIFKREQASLLIQILDQKEKVDSKEKFLELANLIDRYKELNYSKKRKINAKSVLDSFSLEHVTP